MRLYRWFCTSIAITVVLTAVASGVSAQETEDLGVLETRIAKGTALADLIRYAYQTNPSVRAARENWKAVVESYRVATAYPDPEIISSYFPRPIETRLGPQDWNITVSQMIPFPGRLSKAGELVVADARIARLDLDKVTRDLIVRIRQSYYELLYIRDAKRVAAQNRELLDQLRKVGETAYAQERAALVDMLKAQSQSAQLQYDALLLEDLDQVEKARLNTLLNRPPYAEIGALADEPLRPLAYKLDEIYQLAATHQEEILMADARIERAQARVDLARYEILPQFRVGFFYADIGRPDTPVQPPDAGRDAVGVQAGLTIPLWFDKNAGRLSGARVEVRKAESAKSALLNEAYAQIRSLYFRLQNSERLIRLYRDQLLPQAASSLEIAETWYREKQGSFSDFVETEAVFYNFQLALARAKADYGGYLARLERLIGRNLTGKGMETAAAPAVGGAK